MKQFDFRSAPLLLIGRDPDMLSLLREVLLDAGFFVVARLADSFLINLDNSEDRPSLILYDEATPELDAERIFYLLQDNPHWQATPFLVLSDHYDGARTARCLDRGFAEFIAKPFDVDELAARIRKILREIMEHEVLLQQEPDPNTSQVNFEGFAGDLAYMNLSDLLINLHQNRRTGELVLNMEEGDYVFSLLRGKLISMDGLGGKIHGKKALFRAIRIFYGKFVFNPRPAEDIDVGLELHDWGELPNLILSAVQESDEYPLIRKQMPDDSTPIKIANEGASAEIFSGDFRILRPLLKSSDRRSTIDEIILSYPKTDLEAAQELLELFEKELIVAA